MLIIDILVAIGPLVGYTFQYSLISSRKSLGSFSLDTCGIMLTSSILKIMFWFAKGFAMALLVQTILVITMQLALLRLCVNYGQKNCQITGFWRWKKFHQFVYFLIGFGLIMGMLTLLFVKQGIQTYGETIGVLSLAIQSTIGLPQLISNQQNHSVVGLSILMIMTWLLGDIFKSAFFILNTQPLQFIVFGFIQLFIDILIVIQICLFNSENRYEKIGLQSTNVGEIENVFKDSIDL